MRISLQASTDSPPTSPDVDIGNTGVTTVVVDVVVDRSLDSGPSDRSSGMGVAIAICVVVAIIACVAVGWRRQQRKRDGDPSSLNRAITLRAKTMVMVDNPLYPSGPSGPSAPSNAPSRRNRRWRSGRACAEVPAAETPTATIGSTAPTADGYLDVGELPHEYSAIAEDEAGDPEYAAVDDDAMAARKDSAASHYEYSDVADMQVVHLVPGTETTASAHAPDGSTPASRSTYAVFQDDAAMGSQLNFNVYGQALVDQGMLKPTSATRQPPEIPLDQLVIMGKASVIGQGNFGVVKAAKWNRPGQLPQQVAVKVLMSELEESRVAFAEEAALAAQFDHEHVSRLLGVVTVTSPMYLVRTLAPFHPFLLFLLFSFSLFKFFFLPFLCCCRIS